jgi:hypothetical protein
MTVILYAACGSEPRLVQISKQWYVDELPPGRTAHRLYFDEGKGPVLVDREVERYVVWARGVCIMYQAARPEGSVIFSVTGPLTPIAITTSDRLRPWRLDIDSLRRFEGPMEIDRRTVITMEQIKYGDICYPSQLQPPREDKWAQNVRVDAARFKVHESTIEVNGADSVGNSVLSDVAQDGQLALVDELIRAGADVNSANIGGITVLMSAIVRDNGETVRRLLQAGAAIDAQDHRGKTALMHAARYGNGEITKILLDAGASVTIRDNYGMTALAQVPDGKVAESPEVRAMLQRAESGTK